MANEVTVGVLYNQIGEDDYEAMIRKARQDTELTSGAVAIRTVEEQIAVLLRDLRRAGFRSYGVNVRDSFARLSRTLGKRRPDAVFNLVEFFNDDPRQEFMVAGLYELLRIPYTGAPPLTLALCQRKATAKQMLLAGGIRTPRYRVMSIPLSSRRHGLKYPLIVKPVREDASAGIDDTSVVTSYEKMEERVRFIESEFHQPALVEEYIDGRELHVPVLGNFPPRVLPVAEMDFSGLPPEIPNILSFAAKWDPRHAAYHRLQARCPADLPPRVQRNVQAIALAAYRVLGCRDYARIDMRLNRRNQAFVLEVNPNPDLSEDDIFMQSAHRAGLSSTDVLRKIVELALRRTPRAAVEGGDRMKSTEVGEQPS